MIGQQYGYLKVTSLSKKESSKKRYWGCECICGNSTVVEGYELRKGHTKSCGCKKGTLIRQAKTTHGYATTQPIEYRIWMGIKTRCYNPKVKEYKHYGGRGITMCPEWRNDFAAFLSDMGLCPAGYSIDRVDNDGNYESSNCRWSPRHDQLRNTRRNVFLTFNGITKCKQDWANTLNVKEQWLSRQLKKGQLFQDIVVSRGVSLCL